MLLTLLGATASPAQAQDIPETGGRVFGLVGGAFGDGDITPLISGGAGLRITRHLGLDFEVLYAHDLGLPTDNDVVIQTFGAAFAPVERIERSRLVTFLTKMTVEFPVANGRVWPFLTGGGGVGSLRQTVTFRNLPLPLADALGVRIFPPPIFDVTATDLTLTIGGGVDVRVWKGLAIGGDVRYLRLLDDTEGFDFAFVTSRLSYRF
jgi:opacity protein-like surface antigen